MKTLWNVVSFLAVVHLLALLMFAAWLWQSQRLTASRLQEMRALFAISAPQAEQAAAKADAQARATRDRELQEQQKTDPPADSFTQVQLISAIKQQQGYARHQLESEKAMLLEQLSAARGDLDARHASLERERQEWQSGLGAEQQRKVDEQFLQTVKHYEQVAPKQGKKMIIELINANQIDQAVKYLDQMTPRAAGRILKEFKTDSEITLATQLLEKLRTLGVNGQRSAEPSDADNLANSD